MTFRMIAVTVLLLLVTGAPLVSASQSRASDRPLIEASLEQRAGALRAQLLLSPKLGMARSAQIRGDLQTLDRLLARLDAGETPSGVELAAALGRPWMGEGSVSASPGLLQARQEALERRLALAPKLGARERVAIRAQIDELDELIAALERGEDVELARLDRLLGRSTPEVASTPVEIRNDLEVRRARMTRRLEAGPKLGILERERIRQEIEALDAMIEHLEGR
ncbi:MAG: hypothetical protein R3F35_08985 [Myxococcota bacterium]